GIETLTSPVPSSVQLRRGLPVHPIDNYVDKHVLVLLPVEPGREITDRPCQEPTGAWSRGLGVDQPLAGGLNHLVPRDGTTPEVGPEDPGRIRGHDYTDDIRLC